MIYVELHGVMKKFLLQLTGLYLCTFAGFFLLTGWDELMFQGRPWLYGFFMLSLFVSLGVSGIFLGLKMEEQKV